MISTVLGVLGQFLKAIKIHKKCIFQPLHNEVKSVLGIKESYSMGKSPKIFTNRSGQAGGVDSFCFLKTSLRALWFDRMIDTNSQWRSLSRIRFQKTVLKIPSEIYVVFIAILTYHLIKRYKMSSCCLIYKGRYPLKKSGMLWKSFTKRWPPPVLLLWNPY